MPFDCFLVWDNFTDTMRGELGLEKVNELPRGHCVEFHAVWLIVVVSEKAADLLFSGSVPAQRLCPDIAVALDFDRLRLQSTDVRKPQPEVNERDLVLVHVAATI